MDAWILRSKIEKIDNLPTVPPVLKNLLNIIENPNVSLSEIGNFILKDPVLTSRILRVVNSPIYGFPGRISTVSQALILLGLNVVKGMLLGVSVFEVMKKVMAGLWEPHLSKNVPVRTAIVHLSDILVRAKGFGFAGDALVPAVNPSVWEMLDFTETDIKEILDEMEDSFVRTEDVLLIDI